MRQTGWSTKKGRVSPAETDRLVYKKRKGSPGETDRLVYKKKGRVHQVRQTGWSTKKKEGFTR